MFAETPLLRMRPNGKPCTTLTRTLKIRSTGAKVRDKIHVPTISIGGTLLLVGLAALSTPLPLVEIMLLPPCCVRSTD